MDAVERASSGHPGAPMGLAPAAYVLWTRFLKHDPARPDWFDRDRFILSNGHASMLLYAILHLTGYGVSLEDLKNFRQWGSPTAGHPEHGAAPGVETTTGPLGQGIMTAVGMAMAEAHLAARFNRPGHRIVDHHTYVFCGDGDLMEGASQEGISLAGHLGLGKLIVLYDDNHITIEGKTDLAYSDDVKKRFEASHWHVQNLGERGEDLSAIQRAFAAARTEKKQPSLIILRTHIAQGAPHAQDTPESHGAPLGAEEVALTKQGYGWPTDRPFWIPDEVRAHMGKALEKGRKRQADWNGKLAAHRKAHPALHKEFQAALDQPLPAGWAKQLPVFAPADGAAATREISGKVINAAAPLFPWLIGGSADLEPSTKTKIKSSGYFSRKTPGERNIAWGIREHLMCAASSGMALHGGVRPFAATFFVFTDYARPAIRLAAIMKQPVIYVMTHDSIGLGEDGPTHQPIEHLASLRAMPNLRVIRPADANETVMAWRAALERRNGPTVLVLTRQKVPTLDRGRLAPAEGLLKGGYVLSPERGSSPDLILIATGSEVALALEGQAALWKLQIDARVISLPSWELFAEQPAAYRESVLPSQVRARLAIEAAHPMGWERWVGEQGRVIGITRFGASAPAKENFKRYGFTVERVVETAQQLLEGKPA